MEDINNTGSEQQKAQVQAMIEKLRADHPKEAAVLELVQAFATIETANNSVNREPGDYSGATVAFDGKSPQQTLDHLTFWTDESSTADEIADQITTPKPNSWVSFQWQYAVKDATVRGGYRGYGISDGRLQSREREGALELFANIGNVSSEMPLEEVLGQIEYPIVATEHPAHQSYTGLYAYANKTYIEAANSQGN